MVDRLVPLSATHHGDVADAVRPHPLTRFGSVRGAAPGTLETSGWTVYWLSAAATAGAAGRPIPPTTAIASEKVLRMLRFMGSASLPSLVRGAAGIDHALTTTKNPRRPP